MEIRKPAAAGTLESSDCQVTVEPGEGNIEFALEGAVISQYGNQVKRVIMEILENLDVRDVEIAIMGGGTLDRTAKVRMEGAAFRAAG